MNAFIILLSSISMLLGNVNPVKYDIVIQNVGLFDGHRDLGIVNLAINDDTIAAISTEPITGDSVIVGSGKYVIPGLVNAHVHASRIEHLKSGYALGILTLLNMHTGQEEREVEWKKISRDSIGYSVLYGAGHAATVPGGHPQITYTPKMETISDSLSIEDWVDHRIAMHVDYIKIIRDAMVGEATLSFDQIRRIIEYSRGKGYKVVVHAKTVEEMIAIARLKPDGFVHMPERKHDLPVDETFYNTIFDSGAFVIPTGGFSLKSPSVLPDWAVDPGMMSAEEKALIIKKLHEHGILIVAGTDSFVPLMNFGEDYFLELELYRIAGLSNLEILRTATGNAAKAFGLPIGELSVGGKATFVLLDGNPIHDLENLKHVSQVWKNGATTTNLTQH